MAQGEPSILDAGIQKSQVADVYGKLAPGYDLWGWLAESKAQRCLEA
jgi:hypothetical protein